MAGGVAESDSWIKLPCMAQGLCGLQVEAWQSAQIRGCVEDWRKLAKGEETRKVSYLRSQEKSFQWQEKVKYLDS